MEAEKKSKRSAILLNWNETRGFGFCGVRDPNNPTQRQSWFIHISRIERIENKNGIIEPGAQVLFNEEPGERGPLAVDVEVLAVAPRIQRSAGVKTLSGIQKTGAAR